MLARAGTEFATPSEMGRLVLFLVLCATVPAMARLGDTREQAEARYGLEKPQAVRSPNPLLEGARERVFESQGWRIRCALLLAKDGKEYVVREQYQKVFNGEVMKNSGP